MDFSQIVALFEGGRLDEAERLCRAHVAAVPGHGEAWHLLALILYRLGRASEAVSVAERSAARFPSDWGIHATLGRMLFLLGVREKALDSCRRAAGVIPDEMTALFTLANLLVEQGEMEEAAGLFHRALALDPACPEVLGNLSMIRLYLGDLPEAEALARRAVTSRPGYPEGWANLGVALVEQGQLEEGLEAHRRAMELVPDQGMFWCNLGGALETVGRFDDAAAAYDRALSLSPDLLEARFARALHLLRQGDYGQGWREYEWRWAKQPPHARHFTAPLWHGESLEGKTLLLHAEQGFGDSLQFARYVPLAAERGARVIVDVQPALVRLMTSLDGASQLIPTGEPLPAYDCHLPFMSLPLLLGTTLDTIPARIPYLCPDPADVAVWAERLAPLPGLKVGLVWAGEARREDPRSHAIDRRRSMPLDRLRPLLDLPGVSFVSLQKGEPEEQLALLPTELRPLDVMGHVGDFADTAAIMANLDLIITVDTSMSHLAGALGRPVWILNRFDSCWRWLRDRDDTPWYPSARLFRQAAPADWDGVVARVRDALVERLA